MADIERRYIAGDGAYDGKWRIYSQHPSWNAARAQQSVDRLNRTAPKKWEYRASIPATKDRP